MSGQQRRLLPTEGAGAGVAVSEVGLGASSLYSQENCVSTCADKRVRKGGKLHSREEKEAPEEMEGTRI